MDGMLTEERRRRELPAADLAVIKQRSVPAMYIVDGDLRVLHARVEPDPKERRRELALSVSHRAMPKAVERAARDLLKSLAAGEEPVAVAAASLIVRLMPLQSFTESDAYIIFVERFKSRDYMNVARERFALSRRETEVLKLLVEGARTKDIAKKLVIADSTAIFHIKRLFEKTGTRTRTELVSKAIS